MMDLRACESVSNSFLLKYQFKFTKNKKSHPCQKGYISHNALHFLVFDSKPVHCSDLIVKNIVWLQHLQHFFKTVSLVSANKCIKSLVI